MFKHSYRILAIFLPILLSLNAEELIVDPHVLEINQHEVHTAEGAITASGVQVDLGGRLDLTSSLEIKLKAAEGQSFRVEQGAILNARLGPVPPAAPSNLKATQVAA